MLLTINGKEYFFVRSAISDQNRSEAYLALAKNVFGLDFHPWLRSGYPDGSFIPYTLYDGQTAVASVGIAVSDFKWENSVKKFAQISTVMTLPDYRGKDLCHTLIKMVLEEWEHKCDMIYLYANDSVTDFYPKYGFVKAGEHVYSKPVTKQKGVYKKLDLQNPEDRSLLTGYYEAYNNPFSALQMESNLSQMMFHCVTFLHDNIYHVQKHDAVVIAEFEDNNIFCYDIFTDKKHDFDEIIGVLATDQTTSVRLGFTPIDPKAFSVNLSTESNTTVFVYKNTDSLFHTHKVTFPFLSRA